MLVLRETVEVVGDLVTGKEYTKTYKRLGKFAKIYNFAAFKCFFFVFLSFLLDKNNFF